MGWHFRKEMPRLSEFPRQNSRRYAAVSQMKFGMRQRRMSRCTMRLQIVDVRYGAFSTRSYDEIFYLLPQIE